MGCNISKKVETPNENTNNDVSEAKAKASVKIKFYEFTFTVSNKFWEKLFDREKFESVSKKLAQLAEQTLANNGDIYIQDTDGSPYKVTATSLDQTTKGLSKVYEISLTHPNNVKQNYFVKIIPINRKSGNESQMPTLEERELMFYRDILPGIYNLIKQKEQHEDIYIPVPKIFYGKSYKGNEQPEEALIVLNDVKTSEEDAESTNQNIEQIVNAIAVYHAAASAYIRTKNILPKEQEWLTTRSDGFLNDLMKVLPNRIKLIRHLGMSDVADKLTILLPYATEIVTIKPNDDENSLQTILFGDLQISNILFKRKDTKASKLISSRWQSIGLGHPSYDLLHYLFVNTPTDFLRSNLSSVIGLYWQTYNATLSKFGYNLEKENSTFKEFAKEWNKNAIYGTILALLTIPLSEAKEEELAEAVSSKNLSVELKETLLKKLEVLKFCNEEGVIDAALKHHCPSALPLTLPEYFWNELFAINGTISVSKKMEQILDGSLKSDGKDGYYIDIDGIEIKVTVDRGSKLGDGYACDTYAITVAHPDGRVNEAFAKLLPQLPSQREFVSSVGIQEREIKIYKYFHSAIRSLIKEHGLEEESQLLVPKMIFTNTGTSASNESSGVEENKEEAILVMENLKKQGFTSVDKRAGVPLPCVKLALSSLAMYHAAASALLRKAGRGKKPEGLEWLFENLKVDGDAFIFQMLPARLQLVRSLGATELANKVEKLIKNPIKLSDYEALGVFGPMETIIHGDFWSNNMMFKLGDNDKPSDFRMIDWQASRVEHPVADISYFILANTTSEFRKSHLKEVLTEYYSKHVSYLSKFGHDLTDYSFEKFMEEYNKNMFKGFLLALIVVPGVMLQPTEVSKIMADINNELEKKDMSSEEKLTLMGDLFNQKLPEVMRQDNIFLQRMKDLISDVEKSGAIDELLKEFDDNLSKSEWERIFATDGKQTICSKFEDILEGKLKTPDKDGYYIKDDCGKDIKVEITRASAPGDNYACVVYSVSATRMNGSKVVGFAKIIPINRKSGNESQMPTLEERELMFYRDILPGIYNLIKQKEQHEDIYIPVPKIFYGKSYKGNEQPEEALIVLNDVKTSEEDAESTNQNIEQIVNAIAVYHAAASAYIRTKNILPKEQEWLTTRSDGFLNDLMKVLPNRIKLIRHLGMSDVADKLTILLPYATEIVTIKPNDDENSLQTILFGDLQISNILFKRKDTKASKLISSRWQSIGLGHPSYDLLHYLFVNTPTDFLRSNLSSVIGLYWQTYNATLSKFGYNLEKENSTFKEFAKEWNKNAIYGTILALLTIPLSEAKEEELAEAVSSKNLSVELKETLLKKLEVLKFCNEEGVIDAALKHHCPSALPLTLPEYFWNELFAINGTISVSKKMEQILDGSLKSDGKDGYYIDIDGIEIKVTVDRGSKLGDGYACDTYAITVAHPDGRVNEAFAKLLPQLPSQREFVSSVGIQEREIKIYKYFHSAIRSLIKEHGLEEELQLLVPKMIFTNTGTSSSNESSGVEENKEEAILVMENLKKQGFTSVDKRAGVPLPCVKLALSSLAMYHAAASALLRKAGRGKKPEGLEWLFENLKVDGDAFIFQMLPARLQLVRSLGATELANKVEKLIKNPIKLSDYEALGVFGPMETIIHGDFWSNNMMFKLGDNDKPSDFRMIDWQASRVEHPVADISYFILANTTSEFRKSHLKEVLTEYYSKHVSYLSKFGHDLTDYSFEKFMEEYNKNMFKGFLLALIVVPGVMLQPTEVSKIMADINNELEKKDMSSEEKLTLMGDLFNQKLPEVMRQDNIFLQRMKDLISDVEKSGAIDELLKEFDDNLSKSEWERIFATDGKQTICSKFEDILEGKLKTPDKDGYYIKDDCGKDIKVEITRASAPGDNYACVVYSVSATRMNGSKVVGFAKGIPDSPASRMFVEAMLIQDKEVKVYEELLESLRDTIKKKNATDKIHIKTPRLLYGRCDVGSQYVFSLSSKDENNSSSRSTNSGNDEIAQNRSETILVLENLQFNKFRMNDKYAGCDLAHVRVALKALAHYHASTSALMRESTTPPKNLSWLTMEGIDMKMDMGEILKKMLPTRIELLKTLGEGEFACKLEKCLPVIVESFNPLNAGTHGPMEVILHGDFWNNNMLFKYSKDNEPEDIRIVDWQMPRLGHPTADIAYYLFANTTSDFRTEHQATVLKEYFDEYVSSLSLLGHTLGGYHFDLFMKDWRENLIFGTVLALIALPFILMKKEDASEFQEQMESIEMNAADSAEDQFAEAASQMMDSSLSSSMSKNPVIKDRVLGLVRDVQATGILDEAISRLSESKECPFTEEFWETVFTTESDKTISDRLQRIVNGDLKTDDKEYYLVKLENGYEYEVKAEKASAAGDNFMSDVYILDIKGTNGLHKSVFVKVLPSHPSLRGFATASKVHDHEIKTYTEIFPYLRKLLKAAHLDHTIKLAVPDVYYTRLDKPRKDPENGENTSSPNDLESVIVLEDLRQRGFKMNDKRRGCDKHHVRAALTALAHYHATASAFLRKKGYPPRGYEWIKELSFDPTELFTNMFTSRTELLRKLGFNDFADKFEKLIPCVGDLFGFNKAGTHGPMETIAHGDFWNNNMLFLYDENDKVQGMNILDWQVPRNQRPGYDLSNFLLGSTHADFREKSLVTELKSYYSEYKKVFFDLGYDLEKEGHSEELFLTEWHRSCLRGLIYAIFWVPNIYETHEVLLDQSKKEENESKNANVEEVLATALVGTVESDTTEIKKRIGDLIQEFEVVVDEFLAGKLTMD